MKISKFFDRFFGFVLGPIVGFFRGLWGELAQPPKLLYLGNLILASFAAVAGLIWGIVTGARWGLFGQFEHGFFRSSPQEGGIVKDFFPSPAIPYHRVLKAFLEVGVLRVRGGRKKWQKQVSRKLILQY